jgi:allantoate deiminase/N-carbamoyl-L-amino-acid hydrolase
MLSLEKIWEDLFFPLSHFGYTEGKGTTRLSWSPAFQKAQAYLMDYAQKIGLTAVQDACGNLFLTVPGTQDLPPVYTGSHLDTVPQGGKYDGALGITVPLAIANYWHQLGYRPVRPLCIIAFAEEEGTRFGKVCFGSQALTVKLKGLDPTALMTREGQNLPELLQASGLTGNPFTPHFPPGKCFLELHIEQGNALETAGFPLGIVSAIVGIRHFTLTFTGKANHAGTTSMDLRHDALAAASSFITHVYNSALASQRQYVATVGHIKVEPDANNVVPGKAEISLEIRSETDTLMDSVLAGFQEFLDHTAQKYGVAYEIAKLDQIPPLPMDAGLKNLIAEEAQAQNIPYQVQPSWAGHDAMILGHELPTAMFFVPSRGGISHSPEEFTPSHDIGQAAQVLEKVLRHVSAE